MNSASSARPERRAATRYRVPARAQLFWPDARASLVSVSDISSLGCSMVGERLPGVGARVFLSLDVSGLPNVRLPATTVRSERDGDSVSAAVRFDVPASSAQGLDRLLADRSLDRHGRGYVLVIDADTRSRERVCHAVRSRGLRVVGVANTRDAISNVRELPVDSVLVRSDAYGLAALAALVTDAPSLLRIAYGRRDALERALTLGYAHVVADDPTSAKCLGTLLSDRPRRFQDA